MRKIFQNTHSNLLVSSLLFFLLTTSVACSSSKSSKEKNKAYSFIAELADSLDVQYLEKKLISQKIEKINRINRSKNIYNLIIITSQESSSHLMEIMKSDSNVVAIIIEDTTLHNSQGKPVSVKKVKPITKK